MDSRLLDIDFVNAKIYHYENIDRYRDGMKKYMKKRRAEDILFKLMANMRSRLYLAFKHKNWKKGSKTHDLLGCTTDELISYIEPKFKDGMSWENYGKWHIDHVIPVSSAKTPEEIEALCHYSNLQPLWAADNIRKRDRVNSI